MRIIARGTLRAFVRNRVEIRHQRVAGEHLDAWFALASRAEWKSSAELKAMFRTASIVSRERVVFNIMGNDYGLVVAVDYSHSVVLILWVGTHAEYDKVVVYTVEFERERYANSANSQ